jgi:hypothetical protein
MWFNASLARAGMAGTERGGSVSKEKRINGHCTCGRKVVMALDSKVPSCRTDGTRYAYPETIDTDRWCIFRCNSCENVIDESFVPEGAA